MSRPSRPELAAWMVDAVDPDRASDIARAVAGDPALLAEVAALRLRLSEETPAPEHAWSLPPPGVRLPGSPALVSRRADLLGQSEALRSGARFEVELEPPVDPWAVRLVVLTRQEADWAVIFPADRGDDLPVGDLLGKGGSLRVGLTAGERPGRQRWALAFVSMSVPIDWEQEGQARWQVVREAVAEGAGSVVIAREVQSGR